MIKYIQHPLGKLVPPMSQEDYDDLKLDISKNGLLSPITLYEGLVLDGWNRVKICDELGIEIKTVEYEGDCPASYVNSICKRRNMTAGQRAILAVEILPYIEKETKSHKKSNEGLGPSSDRGPQTREIVAKIAGSSGKSVQIVKKLKKSYPNIYEKVKSGGYTIKDAVRNIHAEEKDKVRKEMIEKSQAMVTPSTLTLLQGDCETLSNNIQESTISFIMTDPPYPEEFLPCWSKLGKIAMRVLKPSGFCVAYSGKLHLPEVIKRMSDEGLLYYWQFILLHSGLPAAVHGRKINTGYKPILVFQKPPFKQINGYCSDIIKGSGREKEGHDWQQGEDELEQIFKIFYDGGTVLDPFTGSGTVLHYCKVNNIPAMGYEIDPETYKIALSRIGEEICLK